MNGLSTPPERAHERHDALKSALLTLEYEIGGPAAMYRVTGLAKKLEAFVRSVEADARVRILAYDLRRR
jgi:hypothetical protein